MVMHSRFRAVAFVLLCLGTICCQAQPTRNADLSLALDLSPPSPLTQGTTALLTLEFTNSGPDDLPAVGAGWSEYAHLDFEVISLIAAPPFLCTMYYDDLPGPPGQPSYLVATVFAGPVAAGETKVCTVAVRVAADAEGSIPLEFYATDGQVFVNEPTFANNRAGVVLDFGALDASPARIPSTSMLSIGFMLIGTILAASPLGSALRSNS